MSKYKEAKQYIDMIWSEPSWSRVDIDWLAIEQIKELIDKETPMKPKEINVDWGFGMVGFTCDNCFGVHRAPVGYFQAKLNRCDVCGQKIDWSDEE